MTDKSVVAEGMKAWTVWDAEERMAREGDWRGVAYSIAHDILPLIPEGSADHAYRERARMQIKAADRLTAAVLAADSDKSAVLEQDGELTRFVRMIADLRILRSEDFDAAYPAFHQVLKNRTPVRNEQPSSVTCLTAIIDEAIRLSAHSIQSGAEGGAS